MKKEQKIELFNIFAEALTIKHPILLKKIEELGLQEDDIDVKIAEAISLLKGEDLPEDSDTLKELADKIVAISLNETDEPITVDDLEPILPDTLHPIFPNMTLEDLQRNSTVEYIKEPRTLIIDSEGVSWNTSTTENTNSYSAYSYYRFDVPTDKTKAKITLNKVYDGSKDLREGFNIYVDGTFTQLFAYQQTQDYGNILTYTLDGNSQDVRIKDNLVNKEITFDIPSGSSNISIVMHETTGYEPNDKVKIKDLIFI